MTIIGQPLNRIDGPLKVTGQATYAYEHWEGGQPLYGVIVTATIGRGRIRDLDVSQAERSPGVRAVVTYQNAPAQGARDDSTPWPYSRARPTLSSPDISHYGEAVALVVAATLEQAQAAANLVHIVYSVEPGHFDLAAGKERAYAPKHLISWLPIVPTDTAVGDFESAAQIAAFRDWEQFTGERFANLKSIRQPTLVVNGIYDEMIPVRNSYWLSENLPNAVLLTYPDSGHGSLFQFHESFTRLATAFLASDSPFAPY